jgi:hypothetical protein
MKTANSSRAELSEGGSMNDLRLATARRRLVECCGQTDAIEALREIVSNFLGSEEMALFKADCRTADFPILWSFGVDAKKCNLLWALSEKGLDRILRGECHVEARAGENKISKSIRAFVPICQANETVAVLAIMGLLPQKAGFDRADMDLLALLSTEAGKALFPAGAAPPQESEKRE